MSAIGLGSPLLHLRRERALNGAATVPCAGERPARIFGMGGEPRRHLRRRLAVVVDRAHADHGRLGACTCNGLEELGETRAVLGPPSYVDR